MVRGSFEKLEDFSSFKETMVVVIGGDKVVLTQVCPCKLRTDLEATP
jgi:hypothetical protein